MAETYTLTAEDPGTSLRRQYRLRMPTGAEAIIPTWHVGTARVLAARIAALVQEGMPLQEAVCQVCPCAKHTPE